MYKAYTESINTFFIRLEEQTGLCKPAQIAQSMGVTIDNDNGTGAALKQYLAFTLGVNAITPVEMASAYATLAAQGTYCTPIVITSVVDVSGKNYGGQQQSCHQVLDPNIANEMTDMLQHVVTDTDGTAYGAVSMNNGQPVAGKTGTTDKGIATWFDGYTPQLATAVWTGFIDWNGSSRLANMKIGPNYFGRQIFGADVSAPIFSAAMNGALAGTAVQNFTAPTGFTKPDAGNGNGNGNGNGGNGNGGIGGNNGGNR
jgi:membrane peptidoglycan carboxypeptidase